MRLRFGAYAGETTELLLLKAPDYAAWTMTRRPESALARTFDALSAAFDARPITAACRCGAVASRARAYRNSTDLILLCERCAERMPPDPVLDDVTAYAAALDHVRRTCVRGHRRAQRRIVRQLGLAKGMPRRITDLGAEAFLAGVTS
jgi:hypothetical protein